MTGDSRNVVGWTVCLAAALGTVVAAAVPHSLCGAEEIPRRSLKICATRDAPAEIRKAAAQLLAAVSAHSLLSLLADGRPPTAVTDSRRLLDGPAEQRAYDHLVLVGLPDDPMIEAAWQREVRVISGGLYIFGFGHLRGDIGFLESDRNPFSAWSGRCQGALRDRGRHAHRLYSDGRGVGRQCLVVAMPGERRGCRRRFQSSRKVASGARSSAARFSTARVVRRGWTAFLRSA